MSDLVEEPLWFASNIEGWRHTRVKSAVASIDSGVWGEDPYDDEHSTPVLRSNEIDERGVWRISEPARRLLSEAEQRKARLNEGDLLLVKSSGSAAHIGKTAVVTKHIANTACCFSNFTSRIRVARHATSSRFLWYYLNNSPGRDQLFYHGTTTTGLINLSATTIGIGRLLLPPLPEQERIAAYLDASCAAIDAAMAAKRHQIEALDGLRRTTIARAVTRGLHPSVPMQRTDVPWLPETPRHWRVVRLKDVMQFFNTVRVPLSAAERGLMTERTYDYYGASGVIDKVEAYLFDGTYILIAEDGANLLTRSRPLAFLASGKFWVNNHAHILKPRWHGDDTFFVNLLESQDFSLFVTGAAQPKLTMENLGRFKLAVPPVEEQREIAAVVRQKDAEFRVLSSQIERQAEALIKYRKSLIHECVTGQRRVTDADVKWAQVHG